MWSQHNRTSRERINFCWWTQYLVNSQQNCFHVNPGIAHDGGPDACIHHGYNQSPALRLNVLIVLTIKKVKKIKKSCPHCGLNTRPYHHRLRDLRPRDLTSDTLYHWAIGAEELWTGLKKQGISTYVDSNTERVKVNWKREKDNSWRTLPRALPKLRWSYIMNHASTWTVLNVFPPPNVKWPRLYLGISEHPGIWYGRSSLGSIRCMPNCIGERYTSWCWNLIKFKSSRSTLREYVSLMTWPVIRKVLIQTIRYPQWK
jgi:hypothetical protein